MNEHILKGKWKQIKGEVQSQWGKLTDDDVEQLNGELTKLQGTIQEKYGHTVEDTKNQIDNFLAKFKSDDDQLEA